MRKWLGIWCRSVVWCEIRDTYCLHRLWWFDPAGGIAISLYIVWSWLALAKSQVNKIIGMGAPKDILDALRSVASEHNDDMEVDSVRAYHFGVNYFVEIDIVVSGDMTVTDSHDLAVDLQHKVEQQLDLYCINSWFFGSQLMQEL